MYSQNEIQDYIYEIALCAANHQLFDEAEQLIGYGITEFPEDKLLRLGVVSVERQRGNLNKAIAMIDQFVDSNKADILHAIRIVCYLERKDYQMTKKLIEEFDLISDTKELKAIASNLKVMVIRKF